MTNLTALAAPLAGRPLTRQEQDAIKKEISGKLAKKNSQSTGRRI